MLVRVLEPEVMDTPEEARDYDSMDHSTVNRNFVRDFLAVWHGRGPIIDVGAGTAQIPIEFCRQSSEGKVVAIDLAGEMLALARLNVANAGLSERIELVAADAKRTPFPDGSFHAVMSNSIVHHIPEPEYVFAEMSRLAGPGATIFVRDLMRPRDEAELERLVEFHAAGANEHQRKMFRESLHAALTLAEVQKIVAELGYHPETVQTTSDRHWTWSAVQPMRCMG